MAEPQRRRRRVRSTAEVPDVPEEIVEAAPAAVAATRAVHDEPWPGPTVEPDAPISERGLRGLVGGGSSQVSPMVALRARDAARARPEDLARAEAELTIVRRNWSPRD